MKRSTAIVSALAIWGLVFCSAADAQLPQTAPPAGNTFGQAPRRPTVSPYLQLLRPEALEVPNYQTLVRPQIEMREAEAQNQRAIQQLQQEVANASPTMRTGASYIVRPTGHTSQFLNYLHFYPIRR